jgi:hypothetical protein
MAVLVMPVIRDYVNVVNCCKNGTMETGFEN